MIYNVFFNFLIFLNFKMRICDTVVHETCHLGSIVTENQDKKESRDYPLNPSLDLN